ncbi:hypothetical protein [Nocardia africana]|uniref:Uncharacterized protein n=1 Tax=Nocardia africana TaxID=134964 RepID=A0A378WY82_9NOCA|nr:hypothetical protein [Nocardia africana]MCC3313086.1 hypothetical protein [Nocardia africana]SUA45565.1 Uncharacterised protein [Nocardia africana]
MTTTGTPAPLPIAPAFLAVGRCAVMTAGLLARHRVHYPAENVGTWLSFGDGTSAYVFRETVVDRIPSPEPCVLLVCFQLRGVRGRGHAWFRRESILNTVLFAGFPGLISKLWLAHDQRGVYRGLYEWDGAASAEAYARALWRVLAPVSVPGSIDYRVLPGLRRRDLPVAVTGHAAGGTEWWRVTEFGSAAA